MAHTVETRSTYDEFMKYKYAPAITQATPEFSALLTKLERKTPKVDFAGKSIEIGVLYNSQGSVASVGESDTLPVNMPGNFDNARIPIYWHYFGCAVSGQAIATSSDKESAFAQAWSQEILIKMRAFRQHMNRQLCGDGNAILCQADGAMATDTISVDNAGGWSGFNSSDVNGARFLTVNQYVQARTTGGTVHDAAVYITTVTKGVFPSTSAIIVLSGTVTSWADGDYIYASTGSSTTDDYGHEMPGIKLLVDNSLLTNAVATTVENINADTYNEWNSQVGHGATDGTAEALTTNRMMSLMSDIQVDGGGKTDWIVTSPAVWLTYGNLADMGNQIVNAKTYDTGWPTLSFMGVEVWQDPYLPDEMFFIDNRALKIYEALPAGWITDSKGAVITQVKGASAARDEQEAYWRWYMTLGITNRALCGKMVDISVTADKF